MGHSLGQQVNDVLDFFNSFDNRKCYEKCSNLSFEEVG